MMTCYTLTTDVVVSRGNRSSPALPVSSILACGKVHQLIYSSTAVAWEAGKPLKLETITVDPPKKDEVRIKVLYTALCHTVSYGVIDLLDA